jgi:hypothetical protein
MPFYILTSNPQIIKGIMKGWKVARFGHASRGRGNTRINQELVKSKQQRTLNRISKIFVRQKVE